MNQDHVQLEKLVNEHRDAVYRQMVRVCSNRSDAEDALAQAVLQAFQAADQLKVVQSFRPWLTTIGRRVCHRMRSNDRFRDALQFAEEHDLVSPDQDEMELGVLKGCVKDAVDGLPEIYRDIYVLCEVDEMGVAEAGEQLGISHAAAKSRLLRARRLIADALDQSICGRI